MSEFANTPLIGHEDVCYDYYNQLVYKKNRFWKV